LVIKERRNAFDKTKLWFDFVGWESKIKNKTDLGRPE